MAREVELLSDRDQARMRLAIWAGAAMPHTIVIKELVDNELDVVQERSQPATKCRINLSKNRIKVMDDGAGISTAVKDGTDKTHLWLACAKMFTSSNYGGVSDSVGNNGVGMSVANFTSLRSSIINFNGRTVKGYTFTNGFLDGTEESGVKESGDLAKNPLSYKNANERFEPFYDRGFLVDITWDKVYTDEKDKDKNVVFQDETDLNWLVNYTKVRMGELRTGDVELVIYEDDEFTKEIAHYNWTKNKTEETVANDTYIPSWEERVKEAGGVMLKEDGKWTIAFFTDPNVKIPPIVQGAPIRERYVVKQNIDIQDMTVGVSVPYTIRFVSEEYPAYTDQTKTDIRLPYGSIGRAFERSGEVYKHFYKEAEKAYMAHVIKASDSNMFWPSLGKPEESELIIAEGYSAISGIKANRNPNTQACIALRGKILNCWNLDMQKAMRSDIVKQILNAVLYTPYKKIIIAVDADPDGNHICSLLIALFARFTNVIRDGKLYYVHTPHYLFKKGKDLQWSDAAADCPKGYHVTTLKGLGGMTAGQVETFITNPETRSLQKITWSKKVTDGEAALDHAFSEGGENWII